MRQPGKGRALAAFALGCFAAAFTWLPGAPAPAAAEVPVKRGQYVMGTVLEITLYAPGRRAGTDLLVALFQTAHRLDSLLTSFDRASPVNRLGRAAGKGPQPIDRELARALRLCVRYWHLSGGTFDVTVGPLAQLWRQAGRQGLAPSPTSLAATLALVGSDKLIVTPAATVELRRQGMSLDLGGIGKGYALDRMAETLRARRIKQALLSFGQSSICAIGAPPGADGWHLLLRDPGGGFAGVLTLRDQTLSVSRSLGQSISIGGRPYGHVLDPRTGYPLARDLEGCVIAPSAAEAEALSKALLILGERDGIALLEQLPHVEGVLIEAGGKTWTTSGWHGATAFSPVGPRLGEGPEIGIVTMSDRLARDSLPLPIGREPAPRLFLPRGRAEGAGEGPPLKISLPLNRLPRRLCATAQDNCGAQANRGLSLRSLTRRCAPPSPDWERGGDRNCYQD